MYAYEYTSSFTRSGQKQTEGMARPKWYVAACPVFCCLVLTYIIVFHAPSFRPSVKIEPRPPTARDIARDIARVRARELSQMNKLILLDLLRVFMKVADSHNWNYFLHGGSLIGSVRHGGFIPWDDDVDVLVDEKHTPELKTLFKKMEPKYIVHDRGNDPILKLFSNESYICLKDCKWKWPFLDICFYAQNDSHIWENHPYFAKKKYKKVNVFPLHSRPFENLMVNAPRVSLKWIQVTYGEVSDNCQTWSYNHATERGGYASTKLPCKYLKDMYPFVFRRWVNGTMEETVKVGDKIIRVKLVDEPKWSVTKPYSLEPVGGMQ